MFRIMVLSCPGSSVGVGVRWAIEWSVFFALFANPLRPLRLKALEEALTDIPPPDNLSSAGGLPSLPASVCGADTDARRNELQKDQKLRAQNNWPPATPK